MSVCRCRRALFIVLGLVVVLSFALRHPSARPPVAASSNGAAQAAAQLLAEIQKNGYVAFNSDRGSNRLTFRPELFQPVSARLGNRLAKGYNLSSLGELKKRDQQVTLWKITFKDTGEDALATLSVSGGEVTGFWIN